MAISSTGIRPLLRRLKRAPLFTMVTLLTLAICIGANTAIFSVVRGVLIEPLPYPDPDRLVGVWHTAPGFNAQQLVSSPASYFTYREEGRSFTDNGLWQTTSMSITGLAEPEQLAGLSVTAGVLPILGVRPFLGRPFSAQDDSPGAPLTAILSYGYWKDRFGADPAAVGKTIIVDSRPREIIGVLPREFRFLDLKPSVYVPLRLDRSQVHLGNFSYVGIARLRPGVSLEQASADVARMIAIMPEKFHPSFGLSPQGFREARLGPNLRLLKQDVVGDVGSVLWVLMGTIGMVLLIACANVANLLLVRAEGRQQELAVRIALGARFTDLARDLLSESLLLAAAGGALGLGLAYGAVRLLVALGPGRLPRLDGIAIDLQALLFTFVVALVSGLIFGLIPVFKYARPRAGAMSDGGRTSSQGRERHRLRGALSMAQVSLALVLLIGAGLMIRTFQQLRAVQPGFTHPEQVQTLSVSIPAAQVADAGRAARMHADIVNAIGAIPGVYAVGLSSAIPTSGSSWDPVFVEGRTYAGTLPPMRRYTFVGPDYFHAKGSPLLAGRDVTWHDIFERRPVAMVSDNLARELWGSAAAAIGKRIREMPKSPWREVIGVAADERTDGADQPAPLTVFWPFRTGDFQGSADVIRRSLFVTIRTPRAGSESLVKDVQQAVWSVNSSLPVANVRTLAEVWDRSMARTSFSLVMLGIAGGMALLLGVVGIYGVISYSVSQRTREIGIRMALGAQHASVQRMFVRQGLAMAGAGVVIGLGIAVVLARWMEKMLFGVRPVDGRTYAAVTLLLLAAAVLASYLPARKASRIDPSDALRSE